MYNHLQRDLLLRVSFIAHSTDIQIDNLFYCRTAVNLPLICIQNGLYRYCHFINQIGNVLTFIFYDKHTQANVYRNT